MMNLKKCAIVPFGAALLGGCAIHPVQQDVTRVPTAQVVRQIRCETRFSIIEKAAALIASEPYRHATPDRPPTESEIRRAVNLAGLLRQQSSGPIDLISTYAQLQDREKEFFNRYIKTGVAYVFTFDILEENSIGAAIDPVQMLTRGGMTSVQFGASADLKRGNVRNFAIAENFGDTISDKTLDCRGYQPEPNFAYPVSGSIGMFGVIDTFIDLNQDITLRHSDELKGLNSAAPVFGDTLTFTTTLEASATPAITLTASTTRLGLADKTNFAPLARRTDIHKLAIGLSLAAATEVSPPKPRKKSLFGKDIEVGKATSQSPASGRMLLYRQPFNLPSSAPLEAAPQGVRPPSSTPEERALGVAREQLLLNFYNRLAR